MNEKDIKVLKELKGIYTYYSTIQHMQKVSNYIDIIIVKIICQFGSRLFNVNFCMNASSPGYDRCLKNINRLNTQKCINQIIIELITRSINHDKSKLLSPEYDIFLKFTPKLAGSTYGGEEYKQFLKDMKPALDHHYANNRHHPEHFKEGIPGMNLIDITEMFCDWLAATHRHKDGDIKKSIAISTKRFGLSEQLVSILLNTVKVLETTSTSDCHNSNIIDIIEMFCNWLALPERNIEKHVKQYNFSEQLVQILLNTVELFEEESTEEKGEQ